MLELPLSEVVRVRPPEGTPLTLPPLPPPPDVWVVAERPGESLALHYTSTRAWAQWAESAVMSVAAQRPLLATAAVVVDAHHVFGRRLGGCDRVCVVGSGECEGEGEESFPPSAALVLWAGVGGVSSGGSSGGLSVVSQEMHARAPHALHVVAVPVYRE